MSDAANPFHPAGDEQQAGTDDPVGPGDAPTADAADAAAATVRPDPPTLEPPVVAAPSLASAPALATPSNPSGGPLDASSATPLAGDSTDGSTSLEEASPDDELAVLDGLEADLAAVDTAIATIDRIGADGTGGEQAATEIRAAVSVSRFGGADDASTHP